MFSNFRYFRCLFFEIIVILLVLTCYNSIVYILTNLNFKYTKVNFFSILLFYLFFLYFVTIVFTSFIKKKNFRLSLETISFIFFLFYLFKKFPNKLFLLLIIYFFVKSIKEYIHR